MATKQALEIGTPTSKYKEMATRQAIEIGTPTSCSSCTDVKKETGSAAASEVSVAVTSAASEKKRTVYDDKKLYKEDIDTMIAYSFQLSLGGVLTVPEHMRTMSLLPWFTGCVWLMSLRQHLPSRSAPRERDFD